FQAEDGIRAFHVTGVQTCALPISASAFSRSFFDLSFLPASAVRTCSSTQPSNRSRRLACACESLAWAAGMPRLYSPRSASPSLSSSHSRCARIVFESLALASGVITVMEVRSCSGQAQADLLAALELLEQLHADLVEQRVDVGRAANLPVAQLEADADHQLTAGLADQAVELGLGLALGIGEAPREAVAELGQRRVHGLLGGLGFGGVERTQHRLPLVVAERPHIGMRLELLAGLVEQA